LRSQVQIGEKRLEGAGAGGGGDRARGEKELKGRVEGGESGGRIRRGNIKEGGGVGNWSPKERVRKGKHVGRMEGEVRDGRREGRVWVKRRKIVGSGSIARREAGRREGLGG